MKAYCKKKSMDWKALVHSTLTMGTDAMPTLLN